MIGPYLCIIHVVALAAEVVVNHVVDLLLNERTDVIENSLLLLSHQSIIIQIQVLGKKLFIRTKNIMTCLLGFFISQEADLSSDLVPPILSSSSNTLLAFFGELGSYMFLFPSFY